MSFWPGKGLFSIRNKRLQRVRVVWRPPQNYNNDESAEHNEEQPKKGSALNETHSKGLKQKSTESQEKSGKKGDGDSKKTSKYEKVNNRGKKRRNVKPVSDQSSNSDGSEGLNCKSGDGGNGDDDETVDERGLSETSNDAPVVKKKSRKKRSNRRSKKSVVIDIVKKDDQDTKLKNNKYHDVGSNEEQFKRLENNWEDAGDSGGRISRCSSSSSLSSSCSNHSLIKHYTNIMMNCCDDQFDEDCNVVKNKIDRILKSQWKDRLNRSKEKTSGTTESHSPTPQTSLKHTSTFKLRPARLPLNKKTWSKLKKSNQNTDWLFNNDT
ncbi:uncharacterized protein LOC107365645 [Tetranychus urticae]|uniref:Uncharacterized protein n=1 Tax=Tetranychus urticae TaxID=32264 RepID=T1JTL3_TETUR|nr:uncharacterized protein LOC107365645 [Tetranychus urticae]